MRCSRLRFWHNARHYAGNRSLLNARFSTILGHVLSSKHQAYAVATASALSGASALQRMETHVCNAAARTVTSSHAILKSCASTHDDVTVRVAVPLQIPFAPSVEVVARAGLEDCGTSHK